MEIKVYNKLPDEAKRIREEVFVAEQGFTDEYDEFDKKSLHIVLFDKKAIGTCRIYEKTPGEFMFGRLAVLKEFRQGGNGRKLVLAAEENARKNGGKSVILHAQLHAKGFYEKMGFSSVSAIDSEQGCPHIWMKKEI